MRLDSVAPAPFSMLCVEDDAAARELLHAALAAEYPGVTVYCAANGADGLKLFKQRRPRIVVTDISMPEMDGIRMAAEMRSIEPETVVIAVTAVSDKAYLFDSIAVGVNHYLLKPVDLNKLFEAINGHLSVNLLKREVDSQNDRIRKLSLAVEQSPSSVVIIEADGVIEYVNSRFLTLTGYTPGEVIGQNARMLLSQGTESGVRAELWRVISSGSAWQGELRCSKKNDHPYWVSIAIYPIIDNGTTTHYVTVSEDITVRKVAEQERDSTIEFLRIVNASTSLQDMVSAAMIFFKEKSRCGAVGVRLRDGEDYPYFVAQGFPTDFVQAENSLCGKDAAGELCRDGDGAPLLACMCGNVICGRFDPAQPFFTADGSFWTNSTTELLVSACQLDPQAPTRNRCNSQGYESMALIPLRVGQQRLGLLQFNDRRRGVFSPEDISQWERMAGHLAIALVKFRSEESLKKMNEELDGRVRERTRLLEAALREQESFSYSVSHDLRAPLRHINSYLAVLSEDFGDLLPQEAHRFLNRSRDASGRMGKLIDDLLELSRVGRAAVVKKSVNLSELAAHACDSLCESYPGRRVECVVSDGLSARGDRLLLAQMIGNLVGNAWKYSAGNPAARIEFGKLVDAGQDVFYIRDNGVGFDMAYSDKLFGAFQRLHGPEYEGTGIGLATVKRIIDRHCGKIWAESVIDRGATFYFTLP